MMLRAAFRPVFTLLYKRYVYKIVVIVSATIYVNKSKKINVYKGLRHLQLAGKGVYP